MGDKERLTRRVQDLERECDELSKKLCDAEQELLDLKKKPTLDTKIARNKINEVVDAVICGSCRSIAVKVGASRECNIKATTESGCIEREEAVRAATAAVGACFGAIEGQP